MSRTNPTNNQIIGLIFCSGLGTRLMPYTKTNPKPILLKKDGKSFLEINIERLINLGINNIFVSYSYGYEQFLEITTKYNNKVKLIYEEKPVGQGKTICNLLPQIKEQALLYTVNGDTILEYDGRKLLDHIQNNRVDFLISSSKNIEIAKNLITDISGNLYGWKSDNKEYLYMPKSMETIYHNSLGDNLLRIDALNQIYAEASVQEFLGIFGENDIAEIMIKNRKTVKVINVDVESYSSINTLEEFHNFNNLNNV